MSSPHILTGIRAALTYNLGQITTGNGYNRTINTISNPPRSPEQFKDLPGVNFEFGREVASNQNPGGHTQSGANRWIYHNTTEVYFTYFLQAEDVQLEQEYVLADLQKHFGTGYNYTIPDESNNATCFNFYYINHERFSSKQTSPNCGIEIVYHCIYNQRSDDPTQLR